MCCPALCVAHKSCRGGCCTCRHNYLHSHPTETRSAGREKAISTCGTSICWTVPRQFGIDDTGQLKSVLFQRPVCFIHANAAGVADSTFNLLRTAYYLQADTTAWTGYQVPQELNALQLSGLQADRARQDRIVVDSKLCFGAFRHAPKWRGILSYVYMVTPFNEITFAGLQFFIARPLKLQESRSHGAEMMFDVVSKMAFPMRTRKETGRAKPPNGTQTWFESRNRFDAAVGPLA